MRQANTWQCAGSSTVGSEWIGEAGHNRSHGKGLGIEVEELVQSILERREVDAGSFCAAAVDLVDCLLGCIDAENSGQAKHSDGSQA